MLQNIIS